MKIRTIIIAAAFLTTIVSFGQNTEKLKLPLKSQHFLSDNFSTQTVTSVIENASDSKKGFKAILADNTEVQFWKNGNWREIDGHGKAIPTFFITPPILDYVEKNYSSQKITQVEYNIGKIEIELTNKLKIEFNTDGKFVKAN